LVPADKTLLICLGAPTVNEALLAQPEAGVTRMVNAVEHVLPGTRERIEHAKLYRHEHGYPVFYPGYLRHLREYPSVAQGHKVMLAGDYLVSPTVEGAIRSGERAAQRLIDQLRAAA
jgi:protoporphyrinogen oxidase